MPFNFYDICLKGVWIQVLSAAASNGAGIECAHFSHGQFPFHEQGDAAVGGGNPGIHVVGAYLAIFLCERKGDVIGFTWSMP